MRYPLYRVISCRAPTLQQYYANGQTEFDTLLWKTSQLRQSCAYGHYGRILYSSRVVPMDTRRILYYSRIVPTDTAAEFYTTAELSLQTLEEFSTTAELSLWTLQQNSILQQSCPYRHYSRILYHSTVVPTDTPAEFYTTAELSQGTLQQNSILCYTEHAFDLWFSFLDSLLLL